MRSLWFDVKAAKLGTAMVARMATIESTTRSSTAVNPGARSPNA